MRRIIKVIISVVLVICCLGFMFEQVILPKTSISDAYIPFENIGITSTPLKMLVLHGTPDKTIKSHRDINGKTDYCFQDVEIEGLKADVTYTFHHTSLTDISYCFNTTKENQNEAYEKIVNICEKSLLPNFSKTENENNIEYVLGETCSEYVVVEKAEGNVSATVSFLY